MPCRTAPINSPLCPDAPVSSSEHLRFFFLVGSLTAAQHLQEELKQQQETALSRRWGGNPARFRTTAAGGLTPPGQEWLVAAAAGGVALLVLPCKGGFRIYEELLNDLDKAIKCVSCDTNQKISKWTCSCHTPWYLRQTHKMSYYEQQKTFQTKPCIGSKRIPTITHEQLVAHDRKRAAPYYTTTPI